MTETIKVKKVGKSKFGEWLLVDDGSEKGNFKSSSTQVNGFLLNQVPCEVEVEKVEDIGDRKNVITRVKVLNKVPNVENAPYPDSNEMNVPIEKPGFEQATNYKPSETYVDRQESIVTQFCIREGLHMIEVFNEMSKEEKIKPTKGNVYNNAKIIKEVYNKLLNPEELQDY